MTFLLRAQSRESGVNEGTPFAAANAAARLYPFSNERMTDGDGNPAVRTVLTGAVQIECSFAYAKRQALLWARRIGGAEVSAPHDRLVGGVLDPIVEIVNNRGSVTVTLLEV